MATIKDSTNELEALARQISYKSDLLKDIKENDEAIEKLQATIKDVQDQIKTLLAANLDYFTIEQEKKELEKELKARAKKAVKDTCFTTALFVQYLKAKVKEEAVAKVVEKGAMFRSLEDQSN